MIGQGHKAHLTSFTQNLWMSFALIVMLVLVYTLYVWSEKQIYRAYEQRYLSRMLADELRQSSDDLTRMIRTYAITLDPIYKQSYQDILDIRNGTKERPEKYENIYWDFVTAKIKSYQGQGTAIALLDMMRRTGFSEDEFHKLEEAKRNSDALTATEFEAMQLIDTAGSLDNEVILEKARMMLHDEKYHQQKGDIMKPIDEFFTQVDNRTRAAVQFAEYRAIILRYIFALFGLALIFLLWRTHRLLLTLLGGSVDEVYSNISRIGSGDFSFEIKVPERFENSVLNWLSQTRIRLEQLDSENKLATSKIESAYARVKSVITNAMDGIITIHEDGEIESFNPAAGRIFGYTEDELIGKNINRLMPEPYRSEHDGYLKRYLRMGQTKVIGVAREIPALRKNDEIFSLEISVSEVFWEGQRRFTGIVRDISERKRIEEELRLHREKLEKLVEKRTADLEKIHAVLVHTEKLSALGKLTGSLAHEFNNPLYGVRNILEQMQEISHLLDEEQQYLLTLGVKECDRMASMIRKLQGFYKPSAGIIVSLDIHQALDDTILLLQTQLKARGIQLKKNYASDLPKVEAIEDQMKQVFLNLLKNAEEAISPEGGTITVTTEPLGDAVKISIADTGEGIFPENIKLVFDPFFSTKAIKGTGLGLSVSHGIIKSFGGDIQVESQPGKGTIFTISLPIKYLDKLGG